MKDAPAKEWTFAGAISTFSAVFRWYKKQRYKGVEQGVAKGGLQKCISDEEKRCFADGENQQVGNKNQQEFSDGFHKARPRQFDLVSILVSISRIFC